MRRLKDLFNNFNLNNQIWIARIAKETDEDYETIKNLIIEIKEKLTSVKDFDFYYICLKRITYDLVNNKNNDYDIKYRDILLPYAANKDLYAKRLLNNELTEYEIIPIEDIPFIRVLGFIISPATEKFTDLEIIISFMSIITRFGDNLRDIEIERFLKRHSKDLMDKLVALVQDGVMDKYDAALILESELGDQISFVQEGSVQDKKIFEAEENIFRGNKKYFDEFVKIEREIMENQLFMTNV